MVCPHLKLKNIEKRDLLRIIDRVAEKTPTQANRILAFIKRFFNHCIDMEWIVHNPFRVVKPFKSHANKPRYYFTSKDIDSIISDPGCFHDLYYVLLHTGIRSTDAFTLTSNDIHGKYLKLKMNKTREYLHVPLPSHVLDVLAPRMANLRLFPRLQSERQRRNCVKHLQGLFHADFVRQNNINLHTFRHTYAHNMLNKGVPKEVLQTLLGHRSIKTTEIYANWVRNEELERWV